MIHKCASTGELLFNEVGSDEKRNDQRFWEQPCVAAGGLLSIFLYEKSDDDDYWITTRQKIMDSRLKKPILINFPQLSAHTINKVAPEQDLRESLMQAGIPKTTASKLKITMRGKSLAVEIRGPENTLRETEDN